MPATLGTSEDRIAIGDCLLLYCRALDRRDAGLYRSAFWEDATVDYGFHKGPAYPFVDIAIDMLRDIATSHQIMNSLIRVDGDFAMSETYYEASHRGILEGGSPADTVAGGRYVDRFERRGGKWRILHRLVVSDWVRRYPDSRWDGAFGITEANGAIGRAGSEDASVAQFGTQLLGQH